MLYLINFGIIYTFRIKWRIMPIFSRKQYTILKTYKWIYFRMQNDCAMQEVLPLRFLTTEDWIMHTMWMCSHTKTWVDLFLLHPKFNKISFLVLVKTSLEYWSLSEQNACDIFLHFLDFDSFMDTMKYEYIYLSTFPVVLFSILIMYFWKCLFSSYETLDCNTCSFSM